MKYKLLDEADVIQDGDEFFSSDEGWGSFEWEKLACTEIGSLVGKEYICRRPMQSWQPISTSPKDGTPILVGWWTELTDWDHENKIHVHRGWEWNTTVAQNYLNRVYETPPAYHERDEWQLIESGSYATDCDLSEEPTHWQPLPAEPEKPKAKEP